MQMEIHRKVCGQVIIISTLKPLAESVVFLWSSYFRSILSHKCDGRERVQMFISTFHHSNDTAVYEKKIIILESTQSCQTLLSAVINFVPLFSLGDYNETSLYVQCACCTVKPKTAINVCRFFLLQLLIK